MKDIRLDDHFKGFNNLAKGEPVIKIETVFKPNGWIYCVDSKRDNYCFKRIKTVNIVDYGRVGLIAYDSSIHYFQTSGAPYSKTPGMVWQAIDYIDFRGSKSAEACPFSCDKSFRNIMSKIQDIHKDNVLELTFQFETGDDFRTSTSFRQCYFPYRGTTNIKTLDNAEPNHWLFTAEGESVGHLILNNMGCPIEVSTPNEVTNIIVTSGDY